MKIILTIIISIVAISASSQNCELKVGDSIPNFQFNDVLKYKADKINLSAFKGKLVILDFWSTYCTPCILGMPKMDSLQKKFKDKIIILPIISFNKYDQKTVKQIDSFWTNNPYTKKTSLPTIIDSITKKYFYKEGLPFEVWIDSTGNIIGMTGAEYVNEEDINKILRGEKVEWEDVVKSSYEYESPLLVFNGKLTDELNLRKVASSSLLGYLPSIKRSYQIFDDSIALNKRIIAINFSILDLYRKAISLKFSNDKQDNNENMINGFPLDNRRTIIESNSFSNFYRNPSEYSNKFIWRKKFLYSYELVVPLEYSNLEISKFIFDDLNRFLKLDARIENRETVCLELVLNKYPRNRGIKMDAITFGEFLSQLNSYWSNSSMPILIIDNALIHELVPKEISSILLNQTIEISSLEKNLEKYGINLVEKKKSLPTLVISSK